MTVLESTEFAAAMSARSAVRFVRVENGYAANDESLYLELHKLVSACESGVNVKS